jgi:hypothetical protein
VEGCTVVTVVVEVEVEGLLQAWLININIEINIKVTAQ